jgi:type IV secretory pathway protease TraF
MRPALEAGDWALAVTARRVRRGDVVVLEHPGRPGFEIVKRVRALAGDRTPDGRLIAEGELWVEGDDREGSTDSRGFGPVAKELVRGKLVLVWWPPERRGLI